jgi:BirA family transcriptional regulator, biotin operon repressor / biotin---[acetyl-CoA-carboxylase] ligase
VDIDFVRRRLPGRSIIHLASTDTTMRPAAELAGQGAVFGSIVVADEQTAGQGRHGRLWHSEKDSGLYFSVLLKPDPVLTLALGLAVADGITRGAAVTCDIRWPNDILLNEKKVAGILVQLAGPVAVAGIGINLNHSDFPPPLDREATSLLLQTGRKHSREPLLVAAVEAIGTYCRMLDQTGRQPILEMFERRSSYARGKRVRVEQFGEVITGTTAGLDASGFLLLRRDDGSRVTIMAGGVRPEQTASG